MEDEWIDDIHLSFDDEDKSLQMTGDLGSWWTRLYEDDIKKLKEYLNKLPI